MSLNRKGKQQGKEPKRRSHNGNSIRPLHCFDAGGRGRIQGKSTLIVTFLEAVNKLEEVYLLSSDWSEG